MNIRVPKVNNFHMGVTHQQRGTISGNIDTPEERQLADVFERVEQQEEQLAADLISLDNGERDLDERPGIVETKVDEKNLRQHTILAYDQTTSQPLEMYQVGESGRPSSMATLDKAVRWTETGIQFREHRYFKVKGEQKGMEAVVGNKLPDGLDYHQLLVGYAFEPRV
jgi:hypothetical protein